MKLEKKYEEFTLISSFWSWVILIIFSATIMGWGMFVHMMVDREVPRQWDFGQYPDVPAESEYSTVPAPNNVNVPLQIERLPEAYYDKKAGAAK